VSAILPPAQLALAIKALSEDGLGITLIPLWPARDLAAKRIIVRTQMNSRAPLQVQPGVVLHETDGRQTPQAEAILRHAGALST
jgi:tRNA1(Val) A37 N6-methylase TrmN6